MKLRKAVDSMHCHVARSYWPATVVCAASLPNQTTAWPDLFTGANSTLSTVLIILVVRVFGHTNDVLSGTLQYL